MQEWADEFSIQYPTLMARLRRKDSTLEEALSFQDRRKGPPLTYQGETMTLREWANLVGIAESTAYKRYAHEKNIEHVLFGLPEKAAKLRDPDTGEIRTLSEWAKHWGVTYSGAQFRCAKNRFEKQ